MILSASNTQPASPDSWYDTDWDYRRSVSAGYSGSPLRNYDVLIEIDTASLVAAGKMQADCDDLRVTDSDMTTPYMEVIFAQRNDPVVSGRTKPNSVGLFGLAVAVQLLGSEEIQETEPGEEEVTYLYTYNGDDKMVIEATGTITTVYIGNYYEYVISGAEVITRSYYGVYTEHGRSAGSQRVAMREGGTLFYLLGDHLENA